MGQKTVADTIREITRKHLEENNGILLGECVTAVGWINNTVPDCKGIVELPLTDVAGSGIAVGAALVGRRPILVIRFQDFLILNGSILINYAAKTKELHGKGAPIFVRALASEGLGPVHSGVLHSVFMHFPGFNVFSPMTPNEYQETWNHFMINDIPMMVSEHRDSFSNTEEMDNIIVEKADITIYAISAARFEAKKAIIELKKKGIKCNFINIFKLKPFELTYDILEPLVESRIGLVVDPGYEIAGASRSIAYELINKTGCFVKAVGLYDSTKCLCPPFQNRYPDSKRISEEVKALLDNEFNKRS